MRIITGNSDRTAYRAAGYLLVAVVLLAAGPSAGRDRNPPAEGARIPIDWYESGQIKTQLWAEQATATGGGQMNGTGVRVEFYTPAGELEARLLADDCKYDNKKGTASSKSHVYYDRPDVTITGTGFTWKRNETTITILRDAKVVLKAPMMLSTRDKGTVGAPAGGTGGKKQ